MKIEIFCTNVLESGSAFGLRSDNGEQVFIPASVSIGSGLRINDIVNAIIVPNSYQPEKTPWFVVKIIGESIDEHIEGDDNDMLITLDKFEYASTEELADELGVEVDEAHNTLTKMFNAGRLTKAHVYQVVEAKSKVVSTLWAVELSRFI